MITTQETPRTTRSQRFGGFARIVWDCVFALLPNDNPDAKKEAVP